MAEFRRYWPLVSAAVALRLVLIFFAGDLNLGSRPEIATPVTSLRRLAEGYWLKQSSMSPYAGSMYHGSPLLLSVLGPLTVKRIEGQPPYFICSLMFVVVDLITAMLIRAIGQKLLESRHKNMQLLNLPKVDGNSGNLNAGELASLIFLWNPLTIITCVGSSTMPIDNFMVVLTIYGACTRIAPLAAFGWVMATHLSLYPACLIVPVVLLLGSNLDAPPSKLFELKNFNPGGSTSEHVLKEHKVTDRMETAIHVFSWRPVMLFVLWASIWSFYVLFLSTISLKGINGLLEMFRKTHGFILTVEDLSPNIGVMWYFFAEVFDFFRTFFLIVFHSNILYMILPLAIRLKHRPCFLAFVYILISSMLKSYPSVSLFFFKVNRILMLHAAFFNTAYYILVLIDLILCSIPNTPSPLYFSAFNKKIIDGHFMESHAYCI